MTNELTAIIVDDERKGRELLNVLLAGHCKQVNVLGMAGSAAQAFELIEKKRPDVVFLDIEMPGGSGFQLLEMFGKIDFSIVFVTSFDKYALKAFRFAAVDYLLKPVDESQLVIAVQKVEKARVIQKPEMTEVIANYKNAKGLSNKLALTGQAGLVFVEIEKIIRCQADGKYTRVFLKDEKEILSSKNLAEFEDFLSEHKFFRVHHSHLVNLNYIKSYHYGRTGVIVMADNSEVDVSQRKKEEFLKLLNKI
jgi:two-component system LytT family response regulator